MYWLVGGVVLGVWLLVLGLCRAAAPQSDEERRADDAAQQEALRRR